MKLTDNKGMTTVEYALLLAMLMVAAVGVWSAFGSRVARQRQSQEQIQPQTQKEIQQSLSEAESESPSTEP